VGQSLSIVVPAFNERRRISNLLSGLARFREKNRYLKEIIVVDDGSTDGTARAVRRFGKKMQLIAHAGNMGKGAAVKTGFSAAKGDFVLFMDADGSTSVSQIPKIVSALRDSDLALGSRSVKGARITAKKPFLRHAVSVFANFYINLLFGFGCSDVFCGFKGMRKGLAGQIMPALVSKGWIFDVELIARAKARGARIAEVPVEWGYAGGSKLKPKKLFSAFFELAALRRKLRMEGVLK